MLVALAALAVAAIWVGVIVWQFHDPNVLPTLEADSLPAGATVVLALLALAWGLLGLTTSRRPRWLAAILVAMLAGLVPLWIAMSALTSFADWNLPNRAVSAALFPFMATQLERTLPNVEVLPHYRVHHGAPLPDWESQRLEAHWQRLHNLLGSAPAGLIELYLYQDDEVSNPSDGGTYGRLVFARAMTAPAGCAAALQEVARAFMYTRSRGNSFPQLLDAGWGRANAGCSAAELDREVLQDLQGHRLPRLERRLTATGLADQRCVDGRAVGGSFVRWLVDTYGMRRFLQLIDTATPESTHPAAQAAYGVSFGTLERRWLDHLGAASGRGHLEFSEP